MKAPEYFRRAFYGFLAVVLPLILLLCQRTGPALAQFDMVRFGAWISCMTGMLGLFVLAGLQITGRGLGILVDERNRYSLSRLQITLWTVLIMTTLYVVFAANIVRGDPIFALSVNLDYKLVGLMGISLASFVAGPVALSPKTVTSASASEIRRTGELLRDGQKLEALPTAAGRLLMKCKPADARLADFIRGEDISNATLIDLPRLQMLVITLIVVIVYGATVGHELGSGTWLLKRLPELDETLLVLVLASHGGYLTGKLIPSSSASAIGPQYAVRALQASQRAAALATELQMQLAAAAPGDTRYAWLSSGLALAQGVAAEAAALPDRFGATDFKPDEIALLEGRVDALQTSLRMQPQARTARQIIDAPAAEIVRKVQSRLFQLGHNDVVVTGVADASTEQAIATELAKIEVKRADLDSRPYRYFEEVAQMIC